MNEFEATATLAELTKATNDLFLKLASAEASSVIDLDKAIEEFKNLNRAIYYTGYTLNKMKEAN
jgi:hypothetical protein